MKEQIVKLIECPRDAWQGLPGQIPTERKVQYLRALIAAGFRHLDAVSFVSPKAVPQMADSEAVLAQLAPPNDVEIIGIVVNEKGAERAIATGAVTTLGFPCSISETFLRRNQNQSLEENLATLTRIREKAEVSGLKMVVYISMAFGNPYRDLWSIERLVEAVRGIAALEVGSISLADTVGAAEPDLIRKVVTAVIDGAGNQEIGVHLHSTRAGAEAKCWPPSMPAAGVSMQRSVAWAAVLLRRMIWWETSRPRKSFTPSRSAGCDRPSQTISMKSRD